jgi:hypothetical protein
MEKIIDHISALTREIKDMDRVKLAQELKEIVYHTKKQLFSQIPGVSAIAGILVGSWVGGTFTNSPVRGFLSSWGLMKGGTHVVSTTTYRFLSVVLPILAMVLTAYLVQKAMKTYREKQLEKSRAYVSLLKEEVRSELQAKVNILDMAKEAGLISEREHRTKMANLYQSYVRSDRARIEDILISKLES